APAVMLNYGMFLQQLFDFTIVAFAIFIAIKALNRLKRKEDAQEEKPTVVEQNAQEKLLIEIRDLLKQQQK
ncbi:MAG: MscL family protein, partial [Plesiomonas sp.]